MLTELELVLKHMIEGIEKVNAVNYLTKPPPLVHEYYYYEDAYVVNDQIGGLLLNAEGSNKKN